MNRDQTKRILRFDSALTLPGADEFRASLLSALQDHATVEVDCTQVVEIDLSCLQILLAARRTAASQGKSLVLTGPAESALLAALERGGFLHSIGAQHSPDAAFWAGAGSTP